MSQTTQNFLPAATGQDLGTADQQWDLFAQDIIVSRNLTAQSLNEIRIADQFPGANAGVKIAAAIADLPATGGTVDARGLDGAQSSTVNPFEDVAKPVTLLLGDGTLSTSVPWVISASSQDIIGLGRERTKLRYTGGTADDVLLYEGTGITNGMRFVVRNLQVQGNSSVANAITIRYCARFIVENVQASDVTECGFNMEGAVLGRFANPVVSANSATLSPVPDFGMRFNWDGANISAANLILNPIMEGIAGGTGIKEDHSVINTYIGGTSEGNAIGMEFTADAREHRILGIDFEANTTKDLAITGFENEFYGIHALSALANGVHLIDTSAGTRFLGGRIYNLTIGSGSHLNQLLGTTIINALTDSSTTTNIDNTYVGGTLIGNKGQTFQSLTVQSTAASTPSQLLIQAHASAQGATQLIRVLNAAGTPMWALTAAGESYAVGNSNFEGAIVGASSLYLQPASGGTGNLRNGASGLIMQWGDAVITTSVRLVTPASASGEAKVNLPHGTAPSAPVNGDMWTTTAGLFVRINGATVGPLS